MPVEPDLAELATAHGIAVRYRDSSEREVELDRDVVIDVLRRPRGGRVVAVRPRIGARRRARRGRRCAAGDGRGRRGARPCAAGAGRRDARGRRGARGGHHAADRPARRLPPAGLPGAGRHADRGAAPADAAAPDVGLDGAAVRAALGGLVGLRRLRRPRRRCSRGRPASRRRRAAGEPAARARAGPARRGLAVLAVEPAVPAPALPPGRRHRGLRGGARARSGTRWTRCVPPTASSSTTTRCGRRRARRWRCCTRTTRRRRSDVEALEEESAGRRHLVRAGRAPRQRPALRGRRGWRTSGTRGVPDARAELADRVLFHAWCLDLADAQLAAAHRAADGHGGRADRRPRRRLLVGRRGRLDAGRRARARGDRRRAARRFQPAGPGLGAAAVAAGRPRGVGVRAAAVDDPRGAASRRRDRAWTTSRGCGGCGGSRRAAGRARAPTCTTTRGRCSPSWRSRRPRAGAVVVGEDLGTVEPEVTEGLAEHGMLGCAVLWFQRDASGDLLPPRLWHPETLASVSTHDLPTAAGFLRDEHVRARAEAGLLDDVEEARAASRAGPGRAARPAARPRGSGCRSPRRPTRSCSRCTGSSPRPARGSCSRRSPTSSATSASPTCPGPSTPTPTGASRCPTPSTTLLADPRVVAVASALRERTSGL